MHNLNQLLSFMFFFICLFIWFLFIKAFLKSVYIQNRTSCSFDLYSLLNKLFLEFSYYNLITFPKEIKCKSFEVLIEYLPKVLSYVVFICHIITFKHVGNIAINNLLYIVY